MLLPLPLPLLLLLLLLLWLYMSSRLLPSGCCAMLVQITHAAAVLHSLQVLLQPLLPC
jgi:hypothetical protein